MYSETSRYGNAVLTNAEDINYIDISVNHYEPRGALSLNLDFNGVALHVLATHLGLSPREHRLHVKQLLTVIISAMPPIKILLRDLNEWFIWGRPLRWLHRLLFPPATRC
jgi:endonuclease/exonuclease/phosphatase family metal-dependent hydrolase